MPESILFVLDNLSSKNTERIILSEQQGQRVDVLPLGISEHEARRIFGPNIRIISFSKLELGRFQDDVRAFYVNLPWDICQKSSLLSTFKETYWFLSHTEKNIWRSKLPHWLFYLAQFHNCPGIKTSKVWFLIDDVGLLNLFQPRPMNPYFLRLLTSLLKSMLFEKIKFLYKYFILKIFSLKYPANLESRKDHLLITLYPEWLVIDSKGQCNDMFFSDSIQAEGKDSYWRVGLIIYHWKNLYRFLKKDKNHLKDNDNFFFVESYGKLLDVIKIFNPFFLLKIVKSCTEIMKWDGIFFFQGTDVTSAIKSEVLDSFTNGSFYSNLMLHEAFKRLPWPSYKKCFYRLEFQPFENTFLEACNDEKKFYGFQHSIFGKNFVSYVFPPNLFKRRDLAPALRKPGHILATGVLVKKSLVEAGIDAEEIDVVGAIRFQKLFNFKKTKEELRLDFAISDDQFMIFMPISQILNENIVMLEELSVALSELKKKFNLIIKINPNRKYDLLFIKTIEESAAKLFVNKDLVTTKIFIHDTRYYEFIKASDLLFLSGGSASLEAKILGTPSLIFENKNLFIHNPMSDYPGSFFIVESSSDIKKAIEMLILHPDKKQSAEEKLMMDMFGGITTEARDKFLKSLDWE